MVTDKDEERGTATLSPSQLQGHASEADATAADAAAMGSQAPPPALDIDSLEKQDEPTTERSKLKIALIMFALGVSSSPFRGFFAVVLILTLHRWASSSSRLIWLVQSPPNYDQGDCMQDLQLQS